MQEMAQRPTDDAPERVLTTGEAAAMLGMSKATLLRRVADGRITPVPYSKTLDRPRRMLFPLSEVERLRDAPSEASE